MVAIYWTAKSRNEKTGPIPVSTAEKSTCPDSCALKRNAVTGELQGCYGDTGNVGMLWDQLSDHGENAAWLMADGGVRRSTDWNGLCANVSALPLEQLWRHDQAGDLPHLAGFIRRDLVLQLVEANRGKRGYTYTHHIVLGDSAMAQHNRDIIRYCNANGFVVNLSANSRAEVAALVALDIGPVAVVLPHDMEGKRTQYVDGVAVFTCPATYSDVTCRDCKACAVAERLSVPGFPAHGAAKKRASKIAA